MLKTQLYGVGIMAFYNEMCMAHLCSMLELNLFKIYARHWAKSMYHGIGLCDNEIGWCYLLLGTSTDLNCVAS